METRKLGERNADGNKGDGDEGWYVKGTLPKEKVREVFRVALFVGTWLAGARVEVKNWMGDSSQL